jgi:hypothetical protein
MHLAMDVTMGVAMLMGMIIMGMLMGMRMRMHTVYVPSKPDAGTKDDHQDDAKHGHLHRRKECTFAVS